MDGNVVSLFEERDASSLLDKSDLNAKDSASL
jgi:hypothetical protein